jgi:predicted TIM-barrel enzyme
MTRADALARLRALVEAGKPIIGAGAGTGLSAKLAEAGGADLIIIYNSGRYRMGGRGSLAGLLPYGDANAIVVDMAREVLPVVKSTPVLAGVCGTDPFRLMPVFLDELRRIGFSGVQNFPTVGLFDGTIRVGLEETGMGYGLEVDMIRRALLCAPDGYRVLIKIHIRPVQLADFRPPQACIKQQADNSTVTGRQFGRSPFSV